MSETMNLILPPAPQVLKSASQKARVSTEKWAKENFYCAACGSGLAAFPTGAEVYDFYSPRCGENFQLKSTSHPFRTTILGGNYASSLDSIRKDRFPSLILLHYSLDRWAVEDLSLIHRACITKSCIKPRAPLAPTARRAGWQGYTILLKEIPIQGRIDVITHGEERRKSEVLSQWAKTSAMLNVRPELRGWAADVLRCVERCYSTFTLENMYSFADELSRQHPSNHNIEAKIRQQLQVLRDLGFVEFQAPGIYRRMNRAT